MPSSRRQFLVRTAAGSGAAALGACSGAQTAPPPGAGAKPGSAPPPSPPSSTSSSTPSAPASARAGAGRSAGRDLVSGPRTSGAVALTFHGAGDPRLTRQVLAEAKAARAGLTVLAVGSWLEANPELATAILSQGHDLGNHTWTHLPMRELSAAVARREIARTADLLVRLTGSRGRWFRPSGTPSSTARIRAAAASAGYPRCLGYDVDPRDYQDPGSSVVVSRLERTVTAGSIVSLHLGHPGTVTALPEIFALLQRKGLRPVTMSDLVLL